MTTTTTPDTLSNVPHPAGARSVDEWDTASEAPGRYFIGKKWPLSRCDAQVLIDGFQRVDGTGERFVNLMDESTELLTELTADQAREIGLALLAAADEVERHEVAPEPSEQIIIGADLSRYSSKELMARSRAIVDEIVRRVGVDETCRLLGVASLDELFQLPDVAVTDEIE
jgi:hypothetical protein